MEKKKFIYTAYTALAILLTLPSCVQEDSAGTVFNGGNSGIYFRSYLPTVTATRAGVISKEMLTECRVTAINPDDKNLIDPLTGEMTSYFSDIRFVRDDEERYVADGDDETCLWPDSRSTLHFFAYYPAVDSMQEAIDNEKFNLVNHSRIIEDTRVIDYRLENFRVARDIADHLDFIAAHSYGTQQESLLSGIALNFSHQLARIEISAWGANDKYDFEIAGVRIGNALVEGHFKFPAAASSSDTPGEWLDTSQAVVEHIFTTGESIVTLTKDNESHASVDRAASIMGNAGPAMVIPMAEKIEKWEGKDDPGIGSVPYATNKLYFSVLLRVRKRGEETVVYPYPNDRDKIPVVYLAAGSDGKVIRRIYLIDGEYYTENEKNDELRYTPQENEMVHGFCWAALPVGAKWEAGKIYTYKLNYTNGIGWQDPSDPNPGDVIIERGKIPFEVEVEEWIADESDQPNLDVPKR